MFLLFVYAYSKVKIVRGCTNSVEVFLIIQKAMKAYVIVSQDHYHRRRNQIACHNQDYLEIKNKVILYNH